MATSTPADTPPRLCLLTPAELTRDLLAGAVSTALAHKGVEVLILTIATQAKAPGGLIRDLRAQVAGHGKVFLVEDNLPLALELEAEGALVETLDGFARTRKAIGNEAMVGVACGLSRHKAMEAGEGGADFVALRAPETRVDGAAELDEHIAWWSQLFEVPSVCFGATSEIGAQSQLDAGADFVALGDPLWRNGDMGPTLDKLMITTGAQATGPR